MKEKKPAHWAYLDELDSRIVDNTPLRPLRPRSTPRDILLYVVSITLFGSALYALLTKKIGATGFTCLGTAILFLRAFLFEASRNRRCKATLLGTVESFTRPRRFRKYTRYPVIRYDVDGASYRIHGRKAVHPSAKGNEEWVRYNPDDPSDGFVAKDSKLVPLFWLTAATVFLGVAFLILEMS